MDANIKASWWQQYISQLKKIWISKRRNAFASIPEILLPLILIGALTGLKTISDVEINPAKFYYEESVPVPSLTDFTSPNRTWYIANFPKFYDHGASNLAIVCDREKFEANALLDLFDKISNISLEDAKDQIIEIASEIFDEFCQSLKWTIIPHEASDDHTSIVAKQFEEYLLAKIPSISDSLFVHRDLINDTTSLNDYVKSTKYGTLERPYLGMAVVFYSGGPNWKYAIRLNATGSYSGGPPTFNVPSTSIYTADSERGSTDYSEAYTISGFLTVQALVDSFILEQSLNRTVTIKSSLFAMPTAAYKVDSFWDAAGSSFALFLILAMLYPVGRQIQQLVLEKETKIRELMFIMSLRPSAYTAAWISFQIIVYAIIAAILTGISSVNLFEYSNLSVIFVYFLLYLWASMAFAFFISVLFQKAKLAFLVGLILFFAGYILFAAIPESASRAVKVLVSLLPSAAFSYGTIALGELEAGLIGLKWSNVRDATRGDFPFTTSLGMLLCDLILFLVLALYLDEVLPESGASRSPWHFIFSYPCKWLSAKIHKVQAAQEYKTVLEKANETSIDPDSKRYFEDIPESLKSLAEAVRLHGCMSIMK